MKYDRIKRGAFLSRPNRFVANVIIDGTETACHVKNTGRCRELLREGAEVYLEESSSPSRKYRYSLVTVKKGERLVNMDSQAPNKVVGEWLRRGELFRDITFIKPECTYKSSRFDFYVEHGENKKAFIEVKGVTLENEGVVSFPDAPTVRGSKHLRELTEAVADGYEAYVLFVIQMKDVLFFRANGDNDPEFKENLKRAAEGGVRLLAYDCLVTENELIMADKVKIII